MVGGLFRSTIKGSREGSKVSWTGEPLCIGESDPYLVTLLPFPSPLWDARPAGTALHSRYLLFRPCPSDDRLQQEMRTSPVDSTSTLAFTPAVNRWAGRRECFYEERLQVLLLH